MQHTNDKHIALRIDAVNYQMRDSGKDAYGRVDLGAHASRFRMIGQENKAKLEKFVIVLCLEQAELRCTLQKDADDILFSPYAKAICHATL